MVPQQDVIYLDLTEEEAGNPSEELKQKLLDFYKKGTTLWVVLRVVANGKTICFLPLTVALVDSDNPDKYTFVFGTGPNGIIIRGQVD